MSINSIKMQILGVVGFKSSILTDYCLNTWFVHQNYPLQKDIMLRFDNRSPTHKHGRLKKLAWGDIYIHKYIQISMDIVKRVNRESYLFDTESQKNVVLKISINCIVRITFFVILSKITAIL